MAKLLLKKIIESNNKTVLKEDLIEPSEQILDGAVKFFKQQTGIQISARGIVPVKSKQYNTLTYEISLDGEIRSALMQNIFQTLKMEIVVEAVANQIGGYMFLFSVSYIHPKGMGQNKLDLGTVYYINNTFKGRF